MIFFYGVNVDGGSVNTAISKRLGLKIKKDTPLLVLRHCFNHRLQVAIKDAVSGNLFDKVDVMLRETYHLYKTVLKDYFRSRYFKQYIKKTL